MVVSHDDSQAKKSCRLWRAHEPATLSPWRHHQKALRSSYLSSDEDLGRCLEGQSFSLVDPLCECEEMLAAIGHDVLKHLSRNKYNERVELRLVKYGLMAITSESPSLRTMERSQNMDLSASRLDR